MNYVKLNSNRTSDERDHAPMQAFLRSLPPFLRNVWSSRSPTHLAPTPACALFGLEEANRFVGSYVEIEARAKRKLRPEMTRQL
jgi:hypothetical protein